MKSFQMMKEGKWYEMFLLISMFRQSRLKGMCYSHFGNSHIWGLELVGGVHPYFLITTSCSEGHIKC